MSLQDEARCCKCERRVEPKWRVKDLLALFGRLPENDGDDLIGPTCRKKMIADGVPESAFELVKHEASTESEA